MASTSHRNRSTCGRHLAFAYLQKTGIRISNTAKMAIARRALYGRNKNIHAGVLMSKTTNLDEQHAFPISEKWNDAGMTLRDYFAASVINALLSNSNSVVAAGSFTKDSQSMMRIISQTAYAQADAMLEARKNVG